MTPWRRGGIYPKGMDYKKAYDLSFARNTLQKFQ